MPLIKTLKAIENVLFAVGFDESRAVFYNA
jgi:hypothetical protein